MTDDAPEAAPAATSADGAHRGLHRQLLDRLGSDITSGAIGPADVLSLERLEDRYGMSRTVVREVVKVLESIGVVASRRRVGITVRPTEDWEALSPIVIRWRLSGPGRPDQLRQLSELRRGVEPVAAGLAALRATEEQATAITEAAVAMSVTGARGDLTAYLGHDIRFHRTLLEAAGNDVLAAFAPLVAEALTGRTEHELMPSRPEPTAVRWHLDVAEAIALSDPQRAEVTMRQIVTEAQSAMESMHAREGSHSRRG